MMLGFAQEVSEWFDALRHKRGVVLSALLCIFNQ